MKSIFYSALLVTFLASIHLVSCQECQPDEHAAHPFFCDGFLRCSNGVFVEMFCPPGLYFNPEVSVCDWPVNVNCTPSSVTPPSWNSTTPSWNATTTTPNWNTTTPQWNTTTPNWNTTTSNSTFTTPINPTGTTPNFTSSTTPSWNTTTPQWNTTTSNNTFSIPVNPTGTTPNITSSTVMPFQMKCSNARGPATLPHPNCNYFYMCGPHGRAYEMQCQVGLTWNQIYEYCDYPQNSNCVEGLAPVQ